MTVDDLWHLLDAGRRPENLAQTSGGGIPINWLVRKVAEMQASLAAILAGSLAAAAGVTDPEQLATTIEAARQEAFAAAIQEITDAAAAAEEQ